MSIESHWKYNGEIITDLPPGSIGFVYLITNTTNGMKYVGRKYATRRVKSKINTTSKNAINKKKTKIKIKESDWATYTGSCIPLNQDIEKFGKDKFVFEIIAFGHTKGVVNYIEEYIQMAYSIILRNDFYNNSIGSRRYIAMNNNEKLLKIISSLSVSWNN
jgi:hypothetical protein